MLLAMLGSWAADGTPHYKSMEQVQTIACVHHHHPIWSLI